MIFLPSVLLVNVLGIYPGTVVHFDMSNAKSNPNAAEQELAEVLVPIEANLSSGVVLNDNTTLVSSSPLLFL